MKLHDLSLSASMPPMQKQKSVPHPNSLRLLMRRDGVKQADIARAWGVEDGDAHQRVNGLVRVTQERARKLTEKFGWTATEIYGEVAMGLTPVVGKVGAGIVYAFDDHAQGGGFDEVPRPSGFGSKEMVAVMVDGDSMLPAMRNGWLLFYSKTSDGVPNECINSLCVVCLAGNGMMVRDVRKGSKPGHFHLIAYNGESAFDVKLEWASKILDIRPS
jgi:hypothetical protein